MSDDTWEVLARATRQSMWTQDEWAAWCSELEDDEGAKRKAHLLVHQARQKQTCVARGCRNDLPVPAQRSLHYDEHLIP